MNAQQTAHAQDIFGEAIELGIAERPTFLSSACNGDEAVRREVETLLASIHDAGNFLSAPSSGSEANLLIAAGEIATHLEEPGTRIDRYNLLRLIGEGGFGSVFLAEQERPVRRQVALKIIKLGMDTKQVIARFEAERQALAMMDHPNIARVFDAGATDTGRPYFVMEYVRGVPITSYCDSNNLSTADRLHLFAQVCNAVQHAHQKGIIHRDLKPSNVLVTIHDDMPVPKVIDFGIAKATHAQLTDRTLYTDLRQFIGTPQYMSPEQAEFSGIDIDTRSDVYSLGVLLYELLTGTTPLPAKELRDAGQQVGKLIRETDAPRPSTRLGKLGEDLPRVAAHRGTDPRRLAQAVRGELDWIVMKCLEKDRTRRYDAVSALAADLRRHLADEPVLARPTSASYRLRKLARRHKTAVIAVSIALIGLIGGLAAATYGLIRATLDRDDAVTARKHEGTQRKIAEAATVVAEHQRAQAEAINQFLVEILSAPRPELARGKAVLVRDVLDQAATSIDAGERKFQPQVETSIRQALARSYLSLGEYRAAESQLRKAIALNQGSSGKESPIVAYLLGELSEAVGWGGDRDGAITIARQALAMQLRVNGDASVYTAAAMETLAAGLSHRPHNEAEAQSLARKAIEIRRKLGERETQWLAYDFVLAGNTLQGDPKEKENLLRKGLAMQRKVLPPDHPDIAHSLLNLGGLLKSQGRFEEAKIALQESLAIKQRVFAPDHPDLESTLDMLKEVLEELKDWQSLEPVLLAHYTWTVKRNPGTRPISEMENIERIYGLMGKPDLAKHWRQMVQDAKSAASQPAASP